MLHQQVLHLTSTKRFCLYWQEKSCFYYYFVFLCFILNFFSSQYFLFIIFLQPLFYCICPVNKDFPMNALCWQFEQKHIQTYKKTKRHRKDYIKPNTALHAASHNDKHARKDVVSHCSFPISPWPENHVYFFFLPLPPATGEFCRADADSSLTLSKSRAGCQWSGLRRYIGHGGNVIWSNHMHAIVFSVVHSTGLVEKTATEFVEFQQQDQISVETDQQPG